MYERIAGKTSRLELCRPMFSHTLPLNSYRFLGKYHCAPLWNGIISLFCCITYIKHLTHRKNILPSCIFYSIYYHFNMPLIFTGLETTCKKEQIKWYLEAPHYHCHQQFLKPKYNLLCNEGATLIAESYNLCYFSQSTYCLIWCSKQSWDIV